MLGQSNGSTATGSLGFHGPGSSDDSRNTRHRLDTFSSPEDEQARSAVLQSFALVALDLCVPGVSSEGSSLKPARPLCDGRPFASPLFRRLAGRGALFRGFPFRWVLHFVLSLTRSVIVHDAASCSREDSLSCLCFTALWLQQSQSILVRAGDSASEGYQSDLLQDVPNQGHHMLTVWAHVP